ncbi:31206_t:CDS:2, partial [Gigaspora margarita]
MILSNAIQEAANKHIPWAKAKKIDFICKKVIPKCKYHKELKLLYKICKYKKEKGIAKISHSEHNELRKWANLLKKKAEVLACNMKKKEIQSKIESRFGMINGNRKRMLLSLLNKLVNKIKIDRVLKKEENFYQNSKLVVEETEEEEWLATLNKAYNKTAPDVSGIGYILLKKVSVETTKEFIKFANIILEEGKFSRKWKAQLFLISKSNFWEYNLGCTRPITLLEIFRKVLTRVIHTRLDTVLWKIKILKGKNFAGLSGEST